MRSKQIVFPTKQDHRRICRLSSIISLLISVADIDGIAERMLFFIYPGSHLILSCGPVNRLMHDSPEIFIPIDIVIVA